MTVVVGTAGHIDHGKTALLHALTGIDADRLPEERQRGMTIDVGYAHFALGDGSELDFVDVPGHDKLVGNMLVGAGEIDAVMLVVAADDGPRAQTIEHVELLEALGIGHGIVVITKSDVVAAARIAEVREVVERLLDGTTLAGSPILIASSVSGQGIEDVRMAVEGLRDRVETSESMPPVAPTLSTTRLAVDRIFSIKGRGLVVTGTLRGGPLVRNATLRLVPGGATVRAREVQVHGRTVETAGPGRTALNLVGIDPGTIHRGDVLTTDPQVLASDRLLVLLRRPLPDRTRARLHLGTAAMDATVGRSGRDAVNLGGGAVAAMLRLATPIAACPGDRFVLRRAGHEPAIGGVVLDVAPARGIARRRQTESRVSRLAESIASRDTAEARIARLDLHGALVVAGSSALAGDVREAATTDVEVALGAWAATPDARPRLAEVRSRAARTLRRLATLRRDEAGMAAEALIDDLVARNRLVRNGDHIGLRGTDRPGSAVADPALAGAMERLAGALSASSPPSLRDAARAVGCPEAGIRELVRTGRIVLLDDDLAYEAATYRSIEALALDLASQAPLKPARLRDATATSRKYVMAILADLDRRDVLRRTETGHVPGPRAATIGTTKGASATQGATATHGEATGSSPVGEA